MIRVGIVGGGPGGLMAAWQLDEKCADLVDVTVLEASERLGGKLVTRRFPGGGVLYEAGVAEIYDYAAIGPDPLADLIRDLGLTTSPLGSETVIMGDHILGNLDAVERTFGVGTRRGIDGFRRLCGEAISPKSYYDSLSADDNALPFARMTGHQLLHRAVPDAAARDYLRLASHSDIAAPLYLTSGLNTIKNTLMDVDGYVRLRSIDGGIQRLTDALAQRLIETDAVSVSLGTAATRIGRSESGGYRVTALREGRAEFHDFDMLILALPLSALSQLRWDGTRLEEAMTKHVQYFDRPGHYLRVSVLFETPFWRDQIAASWWISDAFNGCCVYDESSRHDCGSQGVLGWLIAGNEALTMANLDDATLVRRVLDSLPASLRHGGALMREAAVHRWVASVNALPGGSPCRDMRTNHVPEPDDHPGLFIVGDYLFDGTINAVLDSADAATDMALGYIAQFQAPPAAPAAVDGDTPRLPAPRRRIGRSYFENYRGLGPYDQAWSAFFDARYVAELARIAWGVGGGFRILDAGAASGLTVRALRLEGLDAWGIESNRHIHGHTPAEVKAYNAFGDAGDLPFPDRHFDVVYETCLAHVPESKLEKVLSEFHRVARHGVIFASVTSELAIATRERYDLLQGIGRLRTWWEWSEMFFEAGFELALTDPGPLAAAWRLTVEANRGPGAWFEDDETLRYCLYSPAR